MAYRSLRSHRWNNAMNLELMIPVTGILWPWIATGGTINLFRIPTDRHCIQLLLSRWVDGRRLWRLSERKVVSWDGLSTISEIMAAWDGLLGR